MSGTRSRNNLPKRRSGALRPSSRLGCVRASARRVGLRLLGPIRAHARSSIAGAATILAGGGLLIYMLWPTEPTPYHPASRARQYSNHVACLLTDETGITGKAATPVWAGMQQASTSTHMQVTFLAMQGPATLQSAQAYLNTLALRGCNIIITSGTLPDQAAESQAHSYPNLRFIATSEATAAMRASASPASSVTPGNLTNIGAETAVEIQATVDRALTSNAH